MIYDVSQQELVLELSQELKKLIKMPEWALFVKTGSHRETMPKNDDWWYIRAASILRICHKIGPVGVNKLRVRYGGRKNRGMKPDAFRIASGKIIRVLLQQLESANLIKKHAIGTRKGRIATSVGISLMEKAARTIKSKIKTETKAVKSSVEEVEKVEEQPKVEKKENKKAKKTQPEIADKEVETVLEDENGNK